MEKGKIHRIIKDNNAACLFYPILNLSDMYWCL